MSCGGASKTAAESGCSIARSSSGSRMGSSPSAHSVSLGVGALVGRPPCAAPSAVGPDADGESCWPAASSATSASSKPMPISSTLLLSGLAPASSSASKGEGPRSAAAAGAAASFSASLTSHRLIEFSSDVLRFETRPQLPEPWAFQSALEPPAYAGMPDSVAAWHATCGASACEAAAAVPAGGGGAKNCAVCWMSQVAATSRLLRMRAGAVSNLRGSLVAIVL
mmetsp:Transcript_868/g.2236  ORF Transcript_868/g.2236 Transcript_868/m.2236 type:complete len:224 (-) Transcript_868:79-750(-)